MGILKTIVAIILLIFGMGAVPAVGMATALPVAGPDRMIVPAMGTIFAGHAVWAQNDAGENEKADSSTSDGDTKASEPAEDDKTKTTESEPLKPFVPSEKIPGEQAVDFPVDI